MHLRTYTVERHETNLARPVMSAQQIIKHYNSEFSKFSLQFLLKSLEIRTSQTTTAFSKSIPETIELNLPFCLSNVPQKQMGLQKISKDLSIYSGKILEHGNGMKILERTMAYAEYLVENNSPQNFEDKLRIFFESTAKICELGQELDLKQFFFAIKKLPMNSAINLFSSILQTGTYAELHSAISRAHLDAQKFGRENQDSVPNLLSLIH